MKKSDTNQKIAPIKACFFNDISNVIFEEKAEAEDNKFKILAYSGQVIEGHWYWGNVAFDLDGLLFDKNKTPVLDYHAFGNRIGFTTKQDIKPKVVVEGNFLSNEKAQELKSDMKEGFPMQASIYVPPTVIEYIKEGESIKVNGHTLNGPGAVFRKAKIKDVVICTFGYDSHTSSEAFAEGSKQEIEFNVLAKEPKMEEIKKLELTAETFASEYPQLQQQVTDAAKAEGEKQVRDLFGQFAEKFGDDPAFCIEQFKKGATLAEAVEAENAKLKSVAAKKAGKDKQPDPAEQEFSDVQTEDKTGKTGKGDEGKPATFEEAVEQQMKADTSDKSEVSKKAAATRFCVAKYPKLHEKFLESNTRAKKE